MRRNSAIVTCLMVVLAAGIGGTALAGIEPSPFHTVISNRTDRLDPGSPFYNQPFSNVVLTLTVVLPAGAGAVGSETIVTIAIAPPGSANGILAPGGVISLSSVMPTDVTQAGGQIVSWTFSADVGIGPSPFNVFAYDAYVSSSPDPDAAPSIPASYLTGEMPIVGFASPGTLVGSVALVNDEFFYVACPSIPESPESAWKNHGQYVRCVAQRAEWLTLGGLITTDVADAIVSAAARSQTGSK